MSENPYANHSKVASRPSSKIQIWLSRSASWKLFWVGFFGFVFALLILMGFSIESEQGYWTLFVGPFVSTIAVVFCRCQWISKVFFMLAACALFWAGFVGTVLVASLFRPIYQM